VLYDRDHEDQISRASHRTRPQAGCSSERKRQTELLAKQEHLQVARLIAHLAEVSLRRLHLELGYRSLFVYCVKCLGLSEGCTALRIQVCRVCHSHPMILDALAGQRISLTVAGKLASHLTADNRERLIADISLEAPRHRGTTTKTPTLQWPE
jgi:hypothetical protein